MKSIFSSQKGFALNTGLLLVAVALLAGMFYLKIKPNEIADDQSQINAEAMAYQTFTPVLVFDYKPGVENGCYDLKWNSVNTTSCTSSWRPSVATVNGFETVCQGRMNVNGARVSLDRETPYTITCVGPRGSVSKTIKAKGGPM